MIDSQRAHTRSAVKRSVIALGALAVALMVLIHLTPTAHVGPPEQIEFETRLLSVAPAQLTAALRQLKLQNAELSDHAVGWILNPDQEAELLAALKDSRTHLLTRVTARNGSQATILSEAGRPYVEDFTAVKGKNGQMNYKPVWGTLETGLRIKLSGEITPDRKAISLGLNPSYTILDAIEPFPFEDGTVGEDRFIDLPKMRITSLNTWVSIPDASTYMIRGLKRATESGEQGEDEELLLLVKPAIVEPPGR